MSNWIKKLIDEAIERKWCVKFLCTTCGASVFRSTLAIRSCRKAKIKASHLIRYGGLNSEETIRPFLVDLREPDRKKCVKKITESLSEISRRDLITPGSQGNAPGLRIIYDIFYCDVRNIGIKEIVRENLAATPAGQILRGMEIEAKEAAERGKKQEEYESTEEVAKRKQEKSNEKKKKHQTRTKKYEKRNKEIKLFFEKFEKLELEKQLRKIIKPDFPYPLGAIPNNIVENWNKKEVIQKLDQNEKKSLKDKIGNRKGIWKKISKLL